MAPLSGEATLFHSNCLLCRWGSLKNKEMSLLALLFFCAGGGGGGGGVWFHFQGKQLCLFHFNCLLCRWGSTFKNKERSLLAFFFFFWGEGGGGRGKLRSSTIIVIFNSDPSQLVAVTKWTLPQVNFMLTIVWVIGLNNSGQTNNN